MVCRAVAAYVCPLHTPLPPQSRYHSAVDMLNIAVHHPNPGTGVLYGTRQGKVVIMHPQLLESGEADIVPISCDKRESI